MSVSAPTQRHGDAGEQTTKRIDLIRRFTLPVFKDTSLLETIPDGCMLILLPDDDPEFREQEIRVASESTLRGHNVYLRHVRATDLPD